MSDGALKQANSSHLFFRVVLFHLKNHDTAQEIKFIFRSPSKVDQKHIICSLIKLKPFLSSNE